MLKQASSNRSAEALVINAIIPDMDQFRGLLPDRMDTQQPHIGPSKEQLQKTVCVADNSALALRP